MMETPSPYRRLVLVCTNERIDRECCAMSGSLEIHKALKEAIRAKDVTIRVSKSGCLDQCSRGPAVCIQPDNRWFMQVTMADVPVIVEAATSPVSSLV